MQTPGNKSKVAIATLLMLTFAISLITVLPTAGQIIKKPDRATSAYISVNPTLIGVGQPLTVNMWVYPSPSGPNFEIGAAITGYSDPTHQFQGIHFNNLTATFTRPDGSKDTFMPLDGSADALGLIAGMTEEVGTMWFIYTPQQTGTWSVSFSFPGQTYTYLNWSVYYKPSTSRTITFTVQQDLVQIGLPPVELPTGYWTKPISLNNREWSTIGGDWLDNTIVGNFNPYTTAPNSAHILWKMTPVAAAPAGIAGGVYGSSGYGLSGVGWNDVITITRIWNGRIYYTYTTPTDGSHIVAANQYTGETIWERPGSISAFYIDQFGSSGGPGEYAGSPTGNIWYTSTNWTRYNAWTGALDRNFIPSTSGIFTTIPTTAVWNPSYTLAYSVRQGTWNATSFRRPFNELICWNFSKGSINPGTTWESKIQWRISMKQPDGTGPGEGSRGSTIELYPTLGANGTACVYSVGESVFYGFDMNTGAQLWAYDIGFPNLGFTTITISPEDNRFYAHDSSALKLYCWQLPNWNLLWAVDAGHSPWGSQGLGADVRAYGNFYTGTYDGYVTSRKIATGEMNWEFYVGNTTETPYGTWAAAGMLVADEKVYFYRGNEHSPTQPIQRGARLFCIDANTGEHVWNISGWSPPNSVAAGYLMTTNYHLGYTLCFGKGQTATSVTASPKDSVIGNKVVIEGSVLDMSPAQAGTAAISDADMGAWMDYLHMQMPIPMSAKGVEVSLDAVDPNNNFVHIGTATSDSSGTYGLAFNPEVPGLYKVIATFAGSESYSASYAETYVNVEAAPAVTPPAEQVVADNMPIYTAVIAAAIAIIIAIAIVGILLLKKR